MTHTAIFTFGVGDSERNDKYVMIKANDDLSARQAMFERFGREWAFQYDGDTADTKSMIKEYDLKCWCVMDFTTEMYVRPLFIDPQFAKYNKRRCEAILHNDRVFIPVHNHDLYATTDGDKASLDVMSYDDNGILSYDVQETQRLESPFDEEYIDMNCRCVRAEHPFMFPPKQAA